MKKITLTKGEGEGSTLLSAFDAALFDAGIANYNLIHLSSIIPTGFQIVVKKPNINQSEFGKKLYVVIAERRENEIGKEAWAGIGWVLKNDNSGEGLFVEHVGTTKEDVDNEIMSSLNDMKTRRQGNFGEIHSETIGVRCQSKPVCALVAAVYGSESW
ncbi:MAG: hypothetical protein A3G52_00975 [Candidatus Taylorbacteria bacterium RIFCSPLOWO2_12_FULL_43_20]|uniref:Pyruvoyl-dependent arginine decarboxylase AaxB n=1 Tax=Candidatus Taylorbacteria bacterium RIFCSPLOWO2_12_FULL_43_20 TaxID=1802332 RepID=A0A1G2P054_9BACT|nr:MAG: hypothetical protein A2825_01395 [Candidatus Taylorbacteria bacterium RIFCSPHIGHO2_01_FULL_43_120]OHA38059.1 MAG: hypothetical protein A3H58_01115 [Candidatus Taylorbacteria bacterium RIFCSPLOWO2_02_FULL_43_22b]OHA41700.1 MAG: hypothetical protein A3G52_00975 [Candidatus Taylorbacteria bacterium RIFCSPLOWO2_12_FULL_43_20]